MRPIPVVLAVATAALISVLHLPAANATWLAVTVPSSMCFPAPGPSISISGIHWNADGSYTNPGISPDYLYCPFLQNSTLSDTTVTNVQIVGTQTTGHSQATLQAALCQTDSGDTGGTCSGYFYPTTLSGFSPISAPTASTPWASDGYHWNYPYVWIVISSGATFEGLREV